MPRPRFRPRPGRPAWRSRYWPDPGRRGCTLAAGTGPGARGLAGRRCRELRLRRLESVPFPLLRPSIRRPQSHMLGLLLVFWDYADALYRKSTRLMPKRTEKAVAAQVATEVATSASSQTLLRGLN